MTEHDASRWQHEAVTMHKEVERLTARLAAANALLETVIVEVARTITPELRERIDDHLAAQPATAPTRTEANIRQYDGHAWARLDSLPSRTEAAQPATAPRGLEQSMKDAICRRHEAARAAQPATAPTVYHSRPDSPVFVPDAQPATAPALVDCPHCGARVVP